MGLYHSFNPHVATTLIIYVPGHPTSETLARRALASCQAVGQPAELYPGFDGTEDDIRVPSHLSHSAWVGWLKLYDFQSTTQTACALGHISLWARCMDLDQPIVVLEHDAVMHRAYLRHAYPRTIAHLGWGPGSGPMWSPETSRTGVFKNWRFIGGAHAYAIDPLAARYLFAKTLARGIYAPLDVMMRVADIAIIPTPGHALPEPDLSLSIIDSQNGGMNYGR